MANLPGGWNMHNPQLNKEEIEIPATRVPVFKAGKALKDAVSK